MRGAKTQQQQLRPFILRILERFGLSQSASISLPPFEVPPWGSASTCNPTIQPPSRRAGVCWASLQVIAFANWENRTAGNISSRVGKERLKDLQGAKAEALLARRHRVADLYNREMEQWEHEVSPHALLKSCVIRAWGCTC